jgi:hypothetical protein
LCFWSSKKATIALIRPRLAIDNAERTILETKIGQNSEEAGFLGASWVDDAGLLRWKCLVMPIMQICQAADVGLT